MAYFNIEFYSNSLNRPVSFKMIIPNDPMLTFGGVPFDASKPMNTLFLLHGYTGAAGNWVPEEFCTKYNLAIVCPSGENGFWVDGLSSGHNYGTFITEELVNYVRTTFNIAKTPETTFVMGMAMGGFGALRAGLSHPETFGKIVALSPAYIIHDIVGMKPGEDNGMANYEYYRQCFGELSMLEASRNNPEVLIDELLSKGQKLPDIFMAIGTEDFLLTPTRGFEEFLKSRNVAHLYEEAPGGHDMVFWDAYARKFVPMLFEA